jgi:signal peptidase
MRFQSHLASHACCRYQRSDGDVDLLTKGDNNQVPATSPSSSSSSRAAQVDDRGLYAPGQLFLNKRHIIGKATAFLPRVGIVTIIMNDYPYVKYVLIGVLCIFVLTSRE